MPPAGLFTLIYGCIKFEMSCPFPASAVVGIDLHRLNKLLLQRADGYF